MLSERIYLHDGITIRECRPEALLGSLRPAMFALIYALNPDMTEEDFNQRLPAMLDEGYRCLGAFDGEKLIGISGFWVGTKLWCGKYVEPDNVVIHDGYRGRGVGEQMMAWLDDEAKTCGAFIMKLEVYASNRAAQRFYTRHGFDTPGLVMTKAIGIDPAVWRDKIMARTAHH